MVLKLPKLDDRSFKQLMDEAEELVRARCPAWTEFVSAGDPGRTLVEVFAYLTEVMLYRLNRIPEKVHVALLNLLGIALQPPSAATTRLLFMRSQNTDRELRLPAGVQVSDKDGAVIFTVPDELVFPAADPKLAAPQTQEATAWHAELLEGEVIGTGTGEGAQAFRLKRPPVLRATSALETLLIGVEARGEELRGQPEVRKFANKTFLMWQQVESFFNVGPQDRAFIADRLPGTITFAPLRDPGSGTRTLQVPCKGQEIRAWYWRGGGRGGNVASGKLTMLRMRGADITVTNPGRAAGGDEAETLEEAMRRAEASVGVLRTAVTARDFERVAQDAGGIARARAFAQRDRWTFAEPGIVEVQVVPRIEPAALINEAVTADVLAAHQTPDLLERVRAALAAYRPVGVRTVASWTRCRTVGVSVNVVVSPVESAEDMQTRLLASINRLLSPASNWPFGRTLRASDVYEVLLGEPGIRYAEQLRFRIEEGPVSLVRDLVRDPNDGNMMFAATENGLFRSLDFGRSWTSQQEGLPGRKVILVRADPESPGLLAAVVEDENATLWSICVSHDAGEKWELRDRIQAEEVYGSAWVSRDGRAVLMLGTRRALRRLQADGDRGSVNINRLLKDGSDGAVAFNGFFAVASMKHPSGIAFVAIAAREKKGVYLSVEGSEPGSFQLLPGSENKDIRVLKFQRVADRTFLWAGIAAEAGADGDGLICIEARADGIDPAGWSNFGRSWRGGSCEDIDFAGSIVAATSNRAGVLTLDLDQPESRRNWKAPTISCGLPINTDRNALQPVVTVAAKQTEAGLRILAGTQQGLFESPDGMGYQPTGQTGFTEQVPLPALWLYCAGTHEIKVVRELDEGSR